MWAEIEAFLTAPLRCLRDCGAGGHCGYRVAAMWCLGDSTRFPLLRHLVADVMSDDSLLTRCVKQNTDLIPLNLQHALANTTPTTANLRKAFFHAVSAAKEVEKLVCGAQRATQTRFCENLQYGTVDAHEHKANAEELAQAAKTLTSTSENQRQSDGCVDTFVCLGTSVAHVADDTENVIQQRRRLLQSIHS
jgi:hypothetical protein